jgi:hypothetical protein
MLMMMRRPEFLMMRRPEFLLCAAPAPPYKRGSNGLYITTVGWPKILACRGGGKKIKITIL